MSPPSALSLHQWMSVPRQIHRSHGPYPVRRPQSGARSPAPDVAHARSETGNVPGLRRVSGNSESTVLQRRHIRHFHHSVHARRGRHARLRTRLPVSDEHGHGDAPRGGVNGGKGVHVEALLLAGLLHLVAVVLEPDLHLRRSQKQDAGQVLTLRCRQVALLPEPPLELVGLSLREEHAAFLLLRSFFGGAGVGGGVARTAKAVPVIGITPRSALLDSGARRAATNDTAWGRWVMQGSGSWFSSAVEVAVLPDCDCRCGRRKLVLLLVMMMLRRMRSPATPSSI